MALKVVAGVRSDSELVEGCLDGRQESWSELIRRYQQLIQSVIREYQVAPEEALDIFRAVCLELYVALPRLRTIEDMPRWIIRVTSRQCLLWKQPHARLGGDEIDADLLQQQHIVRRALDQLSRPCQDMIQFLFFEDPPVPYQHAAERAGLTDGSTGFIRGRCLKRMRSELEHFGF